MDVVSAVIVVTCVVLVVGFFIGFVIYRRRLAQKGELRDQAAAASSRQIPPSLHPVIDPDVCIGSLSCITACPEGDILGIVNGTAKLIVGSNCIGHGRCAVECPVGAIKLVFGSEERGVDLPAVDTHFETNRRGIHIVGELGGMGLIKNAITQGVQAITHIRRVLPKVPAAPGAVDVVIVGAGPAGLAAGLACIEAGLSYRIFEQGRVGGAMAQYPRHKIVMTSTVKLPLWGKFGRSELGKEELLATWEKIIAKTRMQISAGCRVLGVTGDDGDFAVATAEGTVRARKVVLAIGRRGTPRKLGVPGDDADHVTYELLEPEQYAGKRMLVVGGGDSAVEAALALSDQAGTEVTISYRGDAFSKCRAQNRERIEARIAEGRVRPLLRSELVSVEANHVKLEAENTDRVDVDFVVACLGGELPTAFLQQLGIAFETHKGDRERKSPSLAAHSDDEPSRLGLWLASVGVGIVAFLAFVGFSYYRLPEAERLQSRMHEALRPAGIVGHGIGIVATAFMLSNFLYPMRKRLGIFKGSAPIRSWLTVHMFVGLMSPAVIVFHAAFQSKNMLATSTFAALLVVVVTGAIGRFVYGYLPKSADSQAELSLLSAQLQRYQSALAKVPDAEKMQALQGLFAPVDTSEERKGSLFAHLLAIPIQRLRVALALSKLKQHLPRGLSFAQLSEGVKALMRVRTQLAFYARLRRLMSVWRVLHVVLAVFLVVVIAVHVVVSILIGYRWIFSS